MRLTVRYSLSLILLSMIIHLTHAQTSKEAIETAVDDLIALMINPDSAGLTNIAHDSVVYVHSSGTVRDKAGFVDEFIKDWTMIRDIEIRDQKITITGHNAIVRHRMIADLDKPGGPPQFDIIILMVWIQDQMGAWKLLARQAAQIP